MNSSGLFPKQWCAEDKVGLAKRALPTAISRHGMVVLCTVLAGYWLIDSSAQAQSIWKHRRPSMVNLTADTGARQVGDLITIIVSEETDVANRDQRQLGKASDTAFNMDFASTGDVGSGAGALDFSKDSSRNFNGQSQFSVAQELTDRVTVEILDVLPNGNFVVGGKRQRLVAGETRTLIISGMVRELDISPDNSVRSQHIANFKIAYEGDGPESSFTNQGWAGRFINKIWPF